MQITRSSTLWILVAGLVAAVVLAGCATTDRKLAKEFPDTVEAVVEAAFEEA